jgi:hypothetical protein
MVSNAIYINILGSQWGFQVGEKRHLLTLLKVVVLKVQRIPYLLILAPELRAVRLCDKFIRIQYIDFQEILTVEF